jgi:hypothetical protein
MTKMKGVRMPSERFHQEIEPALDEYRKDRLSERLANGLARAIDHQSDWTFAYYKQVDPSRLNGAKDEKAFRRQLFKRCSELRMMNELSDAAHHRFLDRPSDPPRAVTASTAAYSLKDGELYVPKHETHFLPAANKAFDFWRDWED